MGCVEVGAYLHFLFLRGGIFSCPREAEEGADSDISRQIAANAKEQLRADPAQGFLVHGESAGGNIATVMALLARDEGLSPPLTGVSASIPSVLSREAVPERFKAEYLSFEQNRDAPGLDTAGLDFVLGESLFCFFLGGWRVDNWEYGVANLRGV